MYAQYIGHLFLFNNVWNTMFVPIDFRILGIIRIAAITLWIVDYLSKFVSRLKLRNPLTIGNKDEYGGGEQVILYVVFEADEVNRADIRRAHENSSHIYIAPIFTRQLLSISHGWVARIPRNTSCIIDIFLFPGYKKLLTSVSN